MSIDVASALLVGVDVGSRGVRAAVYDGKGTELSVATRPIHVFQAGDGVMAQSSTDIWAAVVACVRAVMQDHSPSAVAGVGFDATCSLVVVGPPSADTPADHVVLETRPCVPPSSPSAAATPPCDVVMWCDHRAVAEAAHINATRHAVLKHVGGGMSPEMQLPKVLWLKRHKPEVYATAAHFMDVADYLVFRATGGVGRSVCTTTCKWGFTGGKWHADFMSDCGLGDLLADGDGRRIGRAADVLAVGSRAGSVRDVAAAALGLPSGTPVAAGMIDAHSGALGCLLAGTPPTALTDRVAVIAGTSTCIMATSSEAVFPRGVWGPYHDALLPGHWLLEGGQSAAGEALQHVIDCFGRPDELTAAAAACGADSSVVDMLLQRLQRLADAQGLPDISLLTRHFHVVPDYNGNRSPIADPLFTAMVVGDTLQSDSVDGLAVKYLATAQGLGFSTQHILDTIAAADGTGGSGGRRKQLVLCGGLANNPLYRQQLANATQCVVVWASQGSAMLRGCAVVAAVAGGVHPSVPHAMAATAGTGAEVQPTAALAPYFHAKYGVYRKLVEAQVEAKAAMAAV